MFDLKKYPTHQPSLTDLAKLFNEKLKDYFLNVDVSVVDCPDLTLEPFNLAGKGLSSNEPNSNKVIDVGGEPFLIPLPQLERPPYNIVEISRKSGLSENGHVLGAACGPFQTLGCNSELIPNVAYNGDTVKNNTKCSHLTDEENYVVKSSPNTNFNLLGNFYACEGVSGKVLKVKVSQRKNEDDSQVSLNGNLVSVMRKVLNENFKPDTPVSMGGCFIYKGGKAKIHIMPEFSKTPLNNSELVKKWLKFYDFNGPLLCLTAFHSHNNYNLNLRDEHTHCYGIENNVAGGHYHYELDAKNADYEGYFNIASEIVRVDNTGDIKVKFD